MDALIISFGLEMPPEGMEYLLYIFKMSVTLALLGGVVDIIKGITFRLSKGGF